MKKYILLPVVFSIILLLFLSFSNSKRIIVIDAGHGGIDNGATADGVFEKDITLKISHIIKSQNSDKDLEIVLLRSDDSAPSLSERVEFIKKVNPDMVISLHLNYDPKNKDRKGKEIYIQDNEKSRILGEMLAKKFGGDTKVEKQNLQLLRESKVPAILVEMGFLSNEDERKYLTDGYGQTEIAKQIYEFIREQK